MLTHLDAGPGLTVVSTNRKADTQCRRLRVLPYKSTSPRDVRLIISWEQATAAVSVKEVADPEVGRFGPEVDERSKRCESIDARVAALEMMTSVLFALPQAAGVLFARPSNSAVRARLRKPVCAEKSSHIDSYA